ncbi:MAG: EamA family transporter [Candidatus Diapherotrites archaeon]|nr:EamA family transporter [Candidatus Diapherotrites archaeon]
MDWRLAVAATILAWGAQAVVLKYLVSDVSLTSIVFIIWVAGSLGGLAYFLYAGWPVDSLSFRHVFWVLAMGVLAGIGYLGLMYALSVAPATVVLPLTTLNVAVAVVLASFLFRDPLTSREIAGLVLAIAAAFLLAAP